MFHDDPIGSAPPLPPKPEGIISRLNKATALAKHARSLSKEVNPPALFLGQDEWNQLCAICETFNVNWRGVEGYDPLRPDQKRAQFRDFPIYRVDAKSFLAAL